MNLYGGRRNSFLWGDVKVHKGYGLGAEDRLDAAPIPAEFQLSFGPR